MMVGKTGGPAVRLEEAILTMAERLGRRGAERAGRTGELARP